MTEDEIRKAALEAAVRLADQKASMVEILDAADLLAVYIRLGREGCEGMLKDWA